MTLPPQFDGVINYSLYEDDLATGGFLMEPELNGPRLKELGFQTVLDLRLPKEGTATEEEALTACGLSYHNFPIGSIPSSQQVAEFKTLLATLPRPLLIHCTMGPRVYMMLKLAQNNR